MPLLPQLRQKPGEDKKKVVLLGSGGLSIGQAGEFDYSGTQAVRALIEEGLHVIIVNPNIATVQTNPLPNTTVYLYPVEPAWVEKIIASEKPAAIMASFGGQTALNCLIQLDRLNILEKYQVLNLGSSPATLSLTEDRDLFANHMQILNMPVPMSVACDNTDAAVAAAEKIGYPVIVRAAFALGGLGSGFANNKNELLDLVNPALSSSPQVLIEKSLKGWKEVEYEVMRDSQGNTITICNMENFDPLGIHTGDSIVVCPSQSLSDDEYQMLRNAAITIINSLGVIGECNIQYALNPSALEFYIIEVNARLSRSSALASKASGYPIAYVAAKVVLGYDLLEIKNPVTQETYAFTEPALDYVAIKMPRWDLTKFQGASRQLGSTMKSVGEVMSIGRSFPEALQKAVRMVTESGVGLSRNIQQVCDRKKISEQLEKPTDTRLFNVLSAFRCEFSLQEIHQLTSIDLWFLSHLQEIIKLEKQVQKIFLTCHNSDDHGAYNESKFISACFEKFDQKYWKTLKQFGFGDEQLAALALYSVHASNFNWSEKAIGQASIVGRSLRIKCGVVPVAKKIDTTAAEYPTPSNYL
nr:carbamoyl-phosphate synthase large subunit [Oligoflexales bacterium]